MYNHFSLIIFIFCYILFIDVLVLRPSLPVDLLAENVGQSEDILISLFHCALNMENDRKISCNNGDLSYMNKTIFPKRGKVIIILDNLEYIVGSDLITGKHDKSSVRNFPYDDVIPRMRSCFFTFLDWMREQKPRKTPCSILEDENFGCNDIFTGKSINPQSRIDEIHTGSLWEPARQKYCGDDPDAFPHMCISTFYTCIQ